MQPQKNVTQRAIEAAGGPAKVARRFERTTSAVTQWGTNNKVPGGFVVDLCHMTHGLFQPHQLRPDVFEPGVPA